MTSRQLATGEFESLCLFFTLSPLKKGLFPYITAMINMVYGLKNYFLTERLLPLIDTNMLTSRSLHSILSSNVLAQQYHIQESSIIVGRTMITG